MSWGAVAGAAVGVVGGLISQDSQRSAGNKARDAQERAAQLQVDEWKRQFDLIQKTMAPFVTGGQSAFTAMGNLTGLNGPATQQAAIQALQKSPQFGALAKQGENAILANAAATGGLRGGNVQAALGQFRPQLLSQLIDQQYARLGGMASLGQNSAAGVGNAGLQAAGGMSNAFGQMGAAGAGAALAGGAANASLVNGIGQGLGYFAGNGGFGRLFGGQQYTGDTALSNAQLAQQYGF